MCALKRDDLAENIARIRVLLLVGWFMVHAVQKDNNASLFSDNCHKKGLLTSTYNSYLAFWYSTIQRKRNDTWWCAVLFSCFMLATCRSYKTFIYLIWHLITTFYDDFVCIVGYSVLRQKILVYFYKNFLWLIDTIFIYIL